MNESFSKGADQIHDNLLATSQFSTMPQAAGCREVGMTGVPISTLRILAMIDTLSVRVHTFAVDIQKLLTAGMEECMEQSKLCTVKNVHLRLARLVPHGACAVNSPIEYGVRNKIPVTRSSSSRSYFCKYSVQMRADYLPASGIGTRELNVQIEPIDQCTINVTAERCLILRARARVPWETTGLIRPWYMFGTRISLRVRVQNGGWPRA